MQKSTLLLVISLLISLVGFTQKDAPKLVVGVIVDQMCYDYLYRFYPNFQEGGFKKLMDNGSHFRNVTYNYVPTYTGPGHASVYTGTTPSNHGIVANDWYQDEYKRDINCVEDTSVRSIGLVSEDGKCSPKWLRANTITDQLKLTYPNAKVVGASIKDRGAILPAGHFPDGAYWYDYSSGKFITSSYYKKENETWVSNFYATNPFSMYAKLLWELSREKQVYQYANEDNTKYEQLLLGKTTPTFPYDISGLPITDQLNYFTVLPAANTYLTDFSLAALKGEQMGQDAVTDFLTISYSTPDIAGHAFGPYSLEMEDMYFRLDREIARLLTELDKQVGKGQYVVYLTADHAVVPVPQFLKDKNLPGGYLYTDAKFNGLKSAFKAKFPESEIIEITNNNIYLKPGTEYLPNYSEMLSFIRTEVEKWTEVKAVYDRNELKEASGSNWEQMVCAGYDRERSGDLIFILQPGYLNKSNESSAHKGTSHGSAFNYDTHVPVLFYGKGIPKQEVFTPYEITDIAATLVHILDVQRPNAMIGKPMIELFSKPKK